MEQPFADILIRIRKGSRTSYPVEAWLSDGSFYEGKARLTSSLCQQLLQLDYEPVRYGQQLFEALLDGPITTAYDVATGLARQQSDGRLRIRLLLDENVPAEVHALKWERIANSQGIPLTISDDTPFSRYIALPEAEADPLDEPIVRLLFVISAPRDLGDRGLFQIEAEKEVGRLLEALGDVWRGERCQATILPGQSGVSPELRAKLENAGCAIADGNATLDNISEQLRGHHVLHFLGHGQYNDKDKHGYLLLENEDGNLKREIDTDLAVRFSNTPVRLVFLAACESARQSGEPGMDSFKGLAPILVQRGIPAVVGMQEQFEIDAAYRLAGEFYRRLFLEHGTVDRALNEARALLYRKNELDWGTPVLTMRLKTGQLAVANPVWTALQAIRDHSDYGAFRSNQYIDLPLQAILVNKGQSASQYEQPESQRIGTLGLKDAILGHLAAKPSADRSAAASFVLVLGGPSTGKSMQIKLLGWETVQAGLKTPTEQPFLPLYLSLEDYRPSTEEALQEQILNKLRTFMPNLAARSLDELAKQMPQVHLRILISAGDTMPEVGRDLVKLTMALARRHPRHQYVLAIQPSALRWDDLGETEQVRPCVLAIQPLAQREVRHALEALGEPGQRLLDALYDTSLFDLAGAPFFFVKMLSITKKGKAPSSRAEVLQQLIDDAITQIPAGQGMRANALRTLLEMALEMQRSGITTWPVGDVFRVMSSVRGERGYAVEELYASLVKQQLLVPVGEDAVRFAYNSIQAYCCAQAILALPDRDRTLHELVCSLGSPIRTRWWEETLIIISGLLAADPRPDAQQALRRLLEPIIHGADQLEGTRLFLGARCLLECRSMRDTGAEAMLQKLVDHVVNALHWRSDSTNEPDLARRLQATQLLAQLAMPKVTVDLAHKAYSKIRKNIADLWDYEFSSVRFTAAIALKRMEESEAAAVLTEISPNLVELFAAWKQKDIDTLLRHSADSNDVSLQGLAALALGDLHGSLEGVHPDDARRVLDRLNEMFINGETRQGVRWSVADALSLLDSARVTRVVINPLLDELRKPSGTSLRNPAKIRKSLAYLIGLLRLRDKSAHDFLLRECLGLEGEAGPKDWSTWATTITALGRLAVESDMNLLAEIAAGRAKGKALEEIFTQEVQRNYIRREAINALANQGNLDVLPPEDRDLIAREPALCRAYYQAIQEIYWRREATARAAQGGNL